MHDTPVIVITSHLAFRLVQSWSWSCLCLLSAELKYRATNLSMQFASGARPWLSRPLGKKIRSSCREFLRQSLRETTNNSTQARPSFLSQRRKTAAVVLVGAAGITTIASSDDKSLRHFGLTIVRCERIARAVVYDVILYKRAFGASYASEEEKQAAHSNCHKRSAERILEALQANGGMTPLLLQYWTCWTSFNLGIYIKLVGIITVRSHFLILMFS